MPADHTKPGVVGVSRSGRTFIKGIDDRVAPVTAAFSGDRRKAEVECGREHERHRLEAVAELFVLIGVLAKTGLLGRPVNLQLGKTKYQWGKGARADRTEAAHCLPGYLVFDSFGLDDLLAQAGAAGVDRAGVKPIPMFSKVTNLFGQTDLTSLDVNDADSAIESHTGAAGVKVLFPKAGKTLLNELGSDPGRLSWQEVLQAVEKGYHHYRRAALRSARMARDGVEKKIKLNPTRRPVYELRMAILDAYMRQDLDHTQPWPVTRTGFHQILRDVLHRPPE